VKRRIDELESNEFAIAKMLVNLAMDKEDGN
jgi:hypothetical protein